MLEFGSDFHAVKFRSIYQEIENSLANVRYYGTGRSALNSLVRNGILTDGWKRIFVPDYYCYHVVESLRQTGIEILFYPHNPMENNLNPLMNQEFCNGDVLLKINYFGLLESKEFKVKKFVVVVEDHTHSPLGSWARSSNAHWCFASLRKSLPITDGAILWSPVRLKLNALVLSVPDTDTHRLLMSKKRSAMISKSNYLKGKGQEGDKSYLESFREIEEYFDSSYILPITGDSMRLLNEIPTGVYQRKSDNFQVVTDNLNVNFLTPKRIDDIFSLVVVCNSKKEREKFRVYLIENNIYPALLWEVPSTNISLESKEFSECMLSIHIDFRYSYTDLVHMKKIINEFTFNE
jgi:hypothetical protein